jgi:hypothetical protein
MNNRLLLGIATCVISTLLGCDGSSSSDRRADVPPPVTPVAAAPPGALQSAHDAYLDGDFVALGERVRDVLLDARSSELVKENALALLDKAYDVQKGRLPSRFVLPAGFEGIKYGAVRGMSPQGPFYRIFLYGRTRDASHLAGVSVTRLPDEPLLESDATKGKGKLQIKHELPGWDTFVLERVVPALPGDGVLSLRLELDDGTVSEGWFIGRSLASSATPEIKTPVSSASVADTHPQISWAPFHSPEYLPFEWRTISVYVSGEAPNELVWDLWMKDYGDLASVRVGEHPAAKRVSLIPGDYWLNMTCGEVRMFGPIATSRESRTVMPFHLVP